jgi:hypothetical protein
VGLWGHSLEAELILILIVILFFLTILLFIPLKVSFYLVVDDGQRFRVKVSWLFGLIQKDMKKRGEAEKGRKTVEADIERDGTWGGKKEKKKEKDEKSEKRRKRKIPARDTLEILRDREFMDRVLVLIRDLMRSLQFRDFRANLRFGLDCPSDTGSLYGYLSAILALFPADVRLEPSFDQEVVEGDASGSVWFLPYRVMLATLGFLASVERLRRLLWMARVWRRGG